MGIPEGLAARDGFNQSSIISANAARAEAPVRKLKASGSNKRGVCPNLPKVTLSRG
jgi:hypothetical protein